MTCVILDFGRMKVIPHNNWIKIVGKHRLEVCYMGDCSWRCVCQVESWVKLRVSGCYATSFRHPQRPKLAKNLDSGMPN